jgi:hypothetical protein
VANEAGEWKLRLPVHIGPEKGMQRMRSNQFYLRGDAALRALSTVLPHINADGGSSKRVEQAMQVIDESLDVQQLVQRASTMKPAYRADYHMNDGLSPLAALPVPVRLALEMSLHEDDERRAMEGELRELEQRWREADTIARIADGLLVPDTVSKELSTLRALHRDQLE